MSVSFAAIQAERDAARAEIARLREALADYAGHQSWRCDYRTRYQQCFCGLDDLMDELGLDRVPPDDPEASLEG